jgi:hypothetical protein
MEDGSLTADLKLKCCHRKNPTAYKNPVKEENQPSETTAEPDEDPNAQGSINTKYPEWNKTSSNTTTNTLT